MQCLVGKESLRSFEFLAADVTRVVLDMHVHGNQVLVKRVFLRIRLPANRAGQDMTHEVASLCLNLAHLRILVNVLDNVHVQGVAKHVDLQLPLVQGFEYALVAAKAQITSIVLLFRCVSVQGSCGLQMEQVHRNLGWVQAVRHFDLKGPGLGHVAKHEQVGSRGTLLRRREVLELSAGFGEFLF